METYREFFAETYTKHRDYVSGIVCRFVPESDRDDVVQDVFVKALRFWPRFDEDFNGRAWLYKVAVNQCIDSLRKRDRVFEHTDQIDTRNDSETTEAKDLLELVQKFMIDEKGPIRMIPLMLRGKSYRQISKEEQFSIGKIHYWLNRIRDNFRESYLRYVGIK